MSVITITRLYELLADKVGKETAENLTEYIETKIKQGVEDNSKSLATKEDVAKVYTKISESKSEVIKWMFIFWIGQVAVTFGFILLFLNK